MGDLGVTAWVVIVAAVLLGSLVQSVVGIGLGLVAAPMITLVAPQLMPGGMLLLVATFPLLTLAREREDVDWRGIGWSTGPRVLGTVVGVWVVATVGTRGLGIGVGLVVLAAVLLTARTVVVPVTRTNLAVAGLVGGVTGTASSIGGPPMALLLQHRPPRQIRTTLAVYFLVGSGISVVALGIAGELHRDEALAAATLLPVALVGSLLAVPVRRLVAPAVVRPAVLVVCACSALVLLGRSIAG